MSLGLHINVDVRGLRKAVATAPAQVINVMHQSLERSAIKTQSYFRIRMPVGVTSQLRRNIVYHWNDRLSVTIEPTAPYADYVEYGTRPHWTSVHNLEAWSRLRGLNPYAVQRSIAKHGTKPNPYQEWVAENASKFATTDMEQSLRKAIKEII